MELNVDYVENIIGYKFDNHNFLEQAFIRESFARQIGNEGLESNENLELIGDAYIYSIGLKIIIDTLPKYVKKDSRARFFCVGENGGYDEGTLTKIRTKMVERDYLAHRIDEMDFFKFIKMVDWEYQVSEDDQNVKNSEDERLVKIKCDLAEAIIGAVVIDSNWDCSTIEKVIIRMLDTDNFMAEKKYDEPDYLEELQAWFQKKQNKFPAYEIEKSVESNHYTAKVVLNLEKDYLFEGEGYSKTKAKNKAAEKAVTFIRNNKLSWTCFDEIGEEITEDNAVRYLNELKQKGYCNNILYEENEIITFDEDGNKYVEWEENVVLDVYGGRYIEVHEICGWGRAPKKKDAKKYAAYDAIMKWFEFEKESSNWSEEERRKYIEALYPTDEDDEDTF